MQRSFSPPARTCRSAPRALASPVALALALALAALGSGVAAQPTYQSPEPASIGLPGLQGSEIYYISGAVAALDYDRDGDFDLAFSMGHRAPFALLRNDSAPGAPAFVDVSAEAGVTMPGLGFGVGDFDGDGFDDLYVLGLGADALLLNLGDGTFADVSESHLPGYSAFTMSASTGDFDGDGDLDLHVSRYVVTIGFPFHLSEADSLLENDGRGRFRERAAAYGLEHAAPTLTSLWDDVDLDGDLDLLVIHDFGSYDVPNVAYRNDGPAPDGGWRFTDATAEWGWGAGLYAMGLAASDVDGDGASDYLISSIGRQALLRGPLPDGARDAADNLGAAGTFTGEAFRAGWGIVAVDLTGDGYDELYVRSGSLPAAPYIAANGPQADLALDFSAGVARDVFDEVLARGSDAGSEAGRGVVVVDVDGDGEPDLVGASAAAPPRVFLAPDSARHATLRLLPTVSAPGAPTAAVTLRCGAHEIVRRRGSGGTMGSQPPPGVRWIPIPPDCATATLAVDWPSGVRTTVEDVAAGQVLDVREPEWLRLSSRSITAGSDDQVVVDVQPRDAAGGPSGAGLEVTLSVADAPPVALDDLGDGWYRGRVGAPAAPGTVRLALAVDAEPLAARPSIEARAAGPGLAFYPEHPIERTTWTVTLDDPDASGVLGLLVDGEPVPVEPAAGPGLGARAVRALVALGDAGAEVTLQATRDGAPAGPARVREVLPRVDPSRSTYQANTPYHEGEPVLFRLSLAVTARDANGWPALLSGEEEAGLVVTRDGEAVPFSRGVARDGYYTGFVQVSDLVDGARYGVEVAGYEVGTPATYRRFDTPAALRAQVAPERSQLGFSLQGCYADGQDLLQVAARLRNDEGHLLPWHEAIGLAVTGGELVDGPLRLPDRVELSIRCGSLAGVGRAELTIDGVEVGLGADFELYPARSTTLSAATTTLELDEDGEVLVWPRDDAGVLVGSGLDLCLHTDPPGLATVPGYCRPGGYCAELRAPRGGGAVRVELCLGGVDVGVAGIVELSAPGPDAGPDAGVADAGVADAGVADADAAADSGTSDVVEGDRADDAPLADGPVGSGDAGGDAGADAPVDGPGDAASEEPPGNDAGDADADADGDGAPDGLSGDRGGADRGPPDLDAADASGADAGQGGAERVELSAPGCGCAVATPPTAPATAPWWALVAALGALRRRRRAMPDAAVEGRARSRVEGVASRVELGAVHGEAPGAGRTE